MKNKEIIIIQELSNKYKIIDGIKYQLSCTFCSEDADWKIGYKIDEYNPIKFNLQKVCNYCKDKVLIFLNTMEEIINRNIKNNIPLDLETRDEIIFTGLTEWLTKNFEDISLYDTHINDYWAIAHKYWNPLNIEWCKNYDW